MYVHVHSQFSTGFEGGCDYKVYLTSHIFCVKMQFAYPFRTFETTCILTIPGFRWLSDVIVPACRWLVHALA